MPSLPHHILNVDQCSVAVAMLPASTARDGSTLVWLHGLGAASTITFSEVVQDPALSTISSVLIDLPGAGYSSAPKAWSGTIEELGGVALRAIETVATTPVVLFGHSMGGSVAIAAATRRPDLVQHLIVAEPNLDPGTGTISRIIARQSEAAFVDHGCKRLIEATSRLARNGNAGTRAWLTTLCLADPRLMHRAATSVLAPREPTLRQQLLDLPMPKTTITGQLTPPLEPPLPTQSELTGYVVRDAGHQMFVDNPTAFVAILAEIVGRSSN